MKCFLCIDFSSASVDALEREGETIVTFSIAALQANKGGLHAWQVFFLLLLSF